jgi:hypothetical protein
MSRLDEKRFTALGVEWIARFDFNATCAIEEETGESFYLVVAPFLQQMDKGDAADPAKVLAMLGSRSNTTIRLLLFHALARHHADLTIEDVGDIIEDIKLQGAMEVVLWAIGKAMGVQAEGAEGNAKAPTPAPNRKTRRAAASNG